MLGTPALLMGLAETTGPWLGIPRTHIYGRVVLFDRAYWLHQLPRLVQALNYSERMKRAGVPDKVRRKILRRYGALSWALRQEMAQLVADIGRGFDA